MPRFKSSLLIKKRLANIGGWLYPYRGWWLLPPICLLLVLRWSSTNPLQPWGAMVLAIGMALRAWAGMHIGTHSNGKFAEAPDWVRTGPYARIRHPLYVANLIVALGLLLFANCLSLAGSLLFLAVLIGFYSLLAWHEEAVLMRWHPLSEAAFSRFGWFFLAPTIQAKKVHHETGGNRLAWVGRQARNLAYALILLGILAAEVGWHRFFNR